MGEAMKHGHGHGHGGHHGGSPWAHGGQMQVPFVPAPMAFMGMMIAFMFGFTIGHMVSRKQAMMCGDQQWMKHKMMGGGMGHHHHGYGAPPCKEWHGGWPAEQEAPAEDVAE